MCHSFVLKKNYMLISSPYQDNQQVIKSNKFISKCKSYYIASLTDYAEKIIFI